MPGLETKNAVSGRREVRLVDGDAPYEGPGVLVVRWSSPNAPSGELSLPALVERSAARLRSEYLAWIAAVGQTSTRSGPLCRSLDIATLGGVQFWQLTLIAEQSPLKSSAIYATFKLRALERLYTENSCRGIEYVGDDIRLHTILKNWCASLGHSYRHTPSGRSRASRPGWRERLPACLQAMLFAGRAWFGRRRQSVKGRPHSPLDGNLTVVTYFPNIDAARAARGEFRSLYWGRLHALLEEERTHVDWVWLYVASAQYDFAAALRLRDEFDRRAAGSQSHHLLDEFLSLPAMLRAGLAYLELCVRALVASRALRCAFRASGSQLDLFPLFAEDLRASLFGKHAISALLHLAMFRELMRRKSRAGDVLYLWENQPWEKALVEACREVSGFRTCGYQHATLPPLDLRGVANPGGYGSPHVLAVNGAAARDEMLRAGFPEGRLRTVSALRYLYLKSWRGEHVRALPPQKRTLLVVGGFLASETRHQFRLLRAAAPVLVERYARCVVKPHPFCGISIADEIAQIPVPSEITSRTMDELLSEVDVAYCGNSTSASVELAWFGLPIIVAGPGDGMNLSPLFGWPGVEFATDGDLLSNQLISPRATRLPEDFFCLDDLESWRALLSDAARSTASAPRAVTPEREST